MHSLHRDMAVAVGGLYSRIGYLSQVRNAVPPLGDETGCVPPSAPNMPWLVAAAASGASRLKGAAVEQGRSRRPKSNPWKAE
jgi:hypothetical protein